MEQEYTISTGTKIFYGLLAAGMLVFAVYLFDIRNPSVSEGIMLFPILIIAGSVLIVANFIKRKVVIYDDSILVISLFKEKELDFKNIKGCRIGSKLIVIEPVSPEYSRILIGNYIDFGGSSQMTAQIKEKCKDLDAEDYENERKQLLQDTSLGFSETDREAKLKNAKTIAIIYSIGGWGVFALALFTDSKIGIIIAMLYPFLGFGLMWYSKGVIKVITNIKTSVYPHIMVGFMPTAMLLGIRGITLYDTFDAWNILLPSVILSAIMFAAVYFADRIKFVEPVKGKLVLIVIMAAIYGFGTTWNSNCYFDESQPKIYLTTVLDHRIEHGKSTSYYLTIAPWGPVQKETEVDAGRWMYYNAPIGDTVRVKLRPGLLHIPWYVVTKQR
jgi:hypothetical protein